MTTDLAEEDAATEIAMIQRRTDLTRDEILAYLATEMDGRGNVMQRRISAAQEEGAGIRWSAPRLAERVKEEVGAAL